LLGRDEGLELRERRGRVGAVEPTDGHHRRLGGELVSGGVVRTDGGRDPAVGAGVLRQQRGELGAGGGGAEDAARATRAAPAEAAEAAVAGGAPRSPVPGPGSARGAEAPG